jgi:N-acylneuraminate cytidylyltransferase
MAFVRFFSATFLRLLETYGFQQPQPHKRHIQPERYVQWLFWIFPKIHCTNILEVYQMFTAIIPVRAGSRRFKNKNIMPFTDGNLLTYKTSQLKLVKSIETIVVSSDSEEMLQMAKSHGIKTHKRVEEYCDEKTQPFGAVVAHICENIEGDDIIWATCTSPLIEPEDYELAIGKYKEVLHHGCDSLMSVEEIRRYMWNEKGPIKL